MEPGFPVLGELARVGAPSRIWTYIRRTAHVSTCGWRHRPQGRPGSRHRLPRCRHRHDVDSGGRAGTRRRRGALAHRGRPPSRGHVAHRRREHDHPHGQRRRRDAPRTQGCGGPLARRLLEAGELRGAVRCGRAGAQRRDGEGRDARHGHGGRARGRGEGTAARARRTPRPHQGTRREPGTVPRARHDRCQGAGRAPVRRRAPRGGRPLPPRCRHPGQRGAGSDRRGRVRGPGRGAPRLPVRARPRGGREPPRAGGRRGRCPGGVRLDRAGRRGPRGARPAQQSDAEGGRRRRRHPAGQRRRRLRATTLRDAAGTRRRPRRPDRTGQPATLRRGAGPPRAALRALRPHGRTPAAGPRPLQGGQRHPGPRSRGPAHHLGSEPAAQRRPLHRHRGPPRGGRVRHPPARRRSGRGGGRGPHGRRAHPGVHRHVGGHAPPGHRERRRRDLEGRPGAHHGPARPGRHDHVRRQGRRPRRLRRARRADLPPAPDRRPARVAGRMEQALVNDDFVLHLQPILDMLDRRHPFCRGPPAAGRQRRADPPLAVPLHRRARRPGTRAGLVGRGARASPCSPTSAASRRTSSSR